MAASTMRNKPPGVTQGCCGVLILPLRLVATLVPRMTARGERERGAEVLLPIRGCPRNCRRRAAILHATDPGLRGKRGGFGKADRTP